MSFAFNPFAELLAAAVHRHLAFSATAKQSDVASGFLTKRATLLGQPSAELIAVHATALYNKNVVFSTSMIASSLQL